MATSAKPDAPKADVDAALTGGNYEVLRARLATAGAELAKRTEALNARRKSVFGSTEPQLIAPGRPPPAHHGPRADFGWVGGLLRLGYNVSLGLKAETKLDGVLTFHRLEP